MRSLLRAAVLALFACWLLPAPTAEAGVITVTASPGSFDLAANEATSITITWRVFRSGGTGNVLFSNSGSLQLGGTTITVNRRLSRSFTTQQNFVFVETVVVPRSLIVRAIRSGGVITGTYTRIFDDTDFANTGFAGLSITSGGGATFGISRLDLKFLDDDSRATVRTVDSRLRAVARVRFTGTGLLQASWRIATPTSTPGNEIFRPLRLERRQLTGNGEVELISPPLPTTIQGQYLVALVVEDPGLGFDTPRLTYAILPPGAPLAEAAPQSILVSAPAAEGALALGDKIKWSPSPAVAVYRILLLDPAGEPLAPPQEDLQYGAAVRPAAAGEVVAGFYMPGTATEAVLPALVASRLTPGQRYLLQIQALDSAGAPIAESRRQEVYWP